MKKIINHINNNIIPMENEVKNNQREYYKKTITKDELDSKFKKLHREYVKLEKIMNKELNKKYNIYL